MKKHNVLPVMILALLMLITASGVFAAQDGSSLYLRLIRNFGYGGFGKIQGRFTLKVQDPPPNLEEVEFYMDGELVGTAGAAPYEFSFHTSEFDAGERAMSAIGLLSDGSLVESNRISKVFLSSEEAWTETEGVLVPLLVGVGLLTLAGTAVPILFMNKKEFVPGNYGPAGGVVCPRCALPFSRSLMSPNLMVGKLVRCPHCGKTSILPRASTADLKAAEIRYLQKDGTTPVKNNGDLIKQIEDSRFEE